MKTPATPQVYNAALLIQILEEQAAIFAEWLEIEEEMQTALIERRRDDLISIISKQQKTHHLLESLENKRNTFLTCLGANINSGTTLEELKDIFPDEEGHTLQELKNRLTYLVQQVQVKTRLTKEILIQRASHNLTLLTLLSGQDQSFLGYKPSMGGIAEELKAPDFSAINKKA